MKKILLPLGLFIAGVFLAPMVKPMLSGLMSKVKPTSETETETETEIKK